MPPDVDPVPQSLVYLKIIPSQAPSLPFVDEQALTDRLVFLPHHVSSANSAFLFLWLELCIVLPVAPVPDSHLSESFVDTERQM